MARNKGRHYNKQQRHQQGQQQGQQQQNQQKRQHKFSSSSFGGHRRGELPDFYARLGVDRNATTAEIKTAFRRLAKTYHPDKLDPNATSDRQRAKSAELFRQANEAYTVLVDDEQRRKYDAAFFNPGAAGDDGDENDYDDLNDDSDQGEGQGEQFHQHHQEFSDEFMRFFREFQARSSRNSYYSSDGDSGRGSSRAGRTADEEFLREFFRHFSSHFGFEPVSPFRQFIYRHARTIHAGICLLITCAITAAVVSLGLVPFLMFLLHHVFSFLVGVVLYFAAYAGLYIGVFLGVYLASDRLLLHHSAWYRKQLGYRVVPTKE